MTFKLSSGEARLASALLSSLVVLAAPVKALASGYALNEQSASAMGTANAGAAANPENATILFFNPAGLTHLEGASFSAGLTVLDVSPEFSGTATNTIGQPVSGTSGGDFVDMKVVPNFYYSRTINESLSAGIGFFAPFGVAAEYEPDFTGRFFADETEVQALALQPTIAYQLNDQWSFGLGLMLLQVEGKLSKAQDYSALSLPPTSIPSALLREGHFEVSGDDHGVGVNLGVMYQPRPATTLGLSYRSKVDVTLQGDAQLTNVPSATGSNPPIAYSTAYESAEVPLTLPETVTLSLREQLDENWVFYAGATWTRWSQFQNLDIFSAEASGSGPISALGSVKFGEEGMIGHVPERWTNVWAFSVGVSYDYSEALTVKAGYAYDESPIQDQFRTARVPSTDRNWLTLGVQYRLQNQWTIDGAFGYLFIDDTEIDENEYTVDDERIGLANVQGTYDLSAYGVAVQVSKSF